MANRTNETSFDGAMATLKPPAPSEMLRKRVIAMAPAGTTSFSATRVALAATLAIAVIGTAVLHGAGNSSPELQSVIVSEIEDAEDNLDLDLTIAQGAPDDLPLLNEGMGEIDESGEGEVLFETEDLTSLEFALLPIE